MAVTLPLTMASTVRNTGRPTDESYEADWLAYSFLKNDTPTYTTLDFNGDTMTLETFRGDNSELLDSITIEKTKDFKARPVSTFIRTALYKAVEVLGLVYMKIDEVVVAIRGGHF